MENKKKEEKAPEKINRKQAIKKVGLTALTSASLLLLNTKPVSAGSPMERYPDNP